MRNASETNFRYRPRLHQCEKQDETHEHRLLIAHRMEDPLAQASAANREEAAFHFHPGRILCAIRPAARMNRLEFFHERLPGRERPVSTRSLYDAVPRPCKPWERNSHISAEQDSNRAAPATGSEKTMRVGVDDESDVIFRRWRLRGWPRYSVSADLDAMGKRQLRQLCSGVRTRLFSSSAARLP